MADVLDGGRALATDALDGGTRVLLDTSVRCGGTALDERAVEGGDPRATLIAGVVDALMIAGGVASGDDEAFEVRRAVAASVRAFEYSEGSIVEVDREGGGTRTSGGLTEMLRLAAGSQRIGRLTSEEVSALVEVTPALVGRLVDPRQLASLVRALRNPQDWPPPPTPEEPAQLSEDESEATAFDADAAPAPDEATAPPGPQLVAAGSLPSVTRTVSALRKLISKDLSGFLQAMRGVTRGSVTRKHTGPQGDMVHRMIQMHYLLEHAGEQVLVDTSVHTPGGGSKYTRLADMGTAGWKGVLAGLTVGGFVGRPDILNETRHVVYEIKPLNQLTLGAVQLWMRYLLPLNVAEAATAGVPTKAVRAFLGKIDFTGLPGTVPTGPQGQTWRPWLPGTEWRPAAAYPCPDGTVAMAGLAGPGLIVYQIARTKTESDTVEQLDSKTVAEIMAAMLVAALLAGATTKGLATEAGRPAPGLAEAAAMAAALGDLVPELESDDYRFVAFVAGLALALLMVRMMPAAGAALGGPVVAARALAALAVLLKQRRQLAFP